MNCQLNHWYAHATLLWTGCSMMENLSMGRALFIKYALLMIDKGSQLKMTQIEKVIFYRVELGIFEQKFLKNGVKGDPAQRYPLKSSDMWCMDTSLRINRCATCITFLRTFNQHWGNVKSVRAFVSYIITSNGHKIPLTLSFQTLYFHRVS